MSKNFLFSVVIQLVLKTYAKKVKLHPKCNPNIFSEIIEKEENGGGGGDLTQIPYFQFYMGIAA